MKKLSIFLWLMVFVFISYIAYEFQYHTVVGSKDLYAIRQIENSIQSINCYKKNWDYKELLDFDNLVHFTGNKPSYLTVTTTYTIKPKKQQ
jgi:hypothetical protein